MADESQPEKPNDELPKSEYFVAADKLAEGRQDVWRGIGLALLLHLIQVPLALLTTFISLIFVGLSQLVYIIPAIVVYRREGRSGMVKGLIIVAAITFLLNAACTGLFFASLSNMH
jgi:hypothetical protein